MGSGTRAAGTLHAEVLDDFKDQLCVVLIERLQKLGNGQDVVVPIPEVDATGSKLVNMQLIDHPSGCKAFRFVVSKKQ